GLASSTVCLYLDCAKVSWCWAHQRGLVAEPWPDDVRKPRRGSTRKRPLTREESERVLEAFKGYGLPPGWPHPVAALLYDVGARAGEVLALRERDLDRQARTVRFLVTKTKRPRTVEVSPDVLELLPVRGDPDALVFRGPRSDSRPDRPLHVATVNHA